MKIALVTDAWAPQVNGVVTTLVELAREMAEAGHEMQVVHPGLFETRPCPGYAGIELAVRPGRRLARLLDDFVPDAIHIATEGPLGWAARRYCLGRRLAFTTAFHTRFPEILNAATRIPVAWGYALMRRFHAPSSGVMVPTEGVLHMLEGRGFRNLRSWTHGVDTRLFEYSARPLDVPEFDGLPRPIALFVGRVSYEKNIEAFLQMQFPGSKVVCGVGPVEAQLRRRYPHVRWLGLQPRPQLARIYAGANLFVFPSLSETFGLVMAEAMACGTPVAAFPVDGPLEVLGRLDEAGRRLGGAMDEDLRVAAFGALAIPRHEARARALDFSWGRAGRLFESHFVNAWQCGEPLAAPPRPVTKLSSG